MFQEAVMIPIGDWVEERLRNLSENDKRRFESRSRSGFGKNISHWLTREKVYPTNVLHLATECSNKDHSAVFPEALPEWFIKLFTEVGDTVLDPFMGSGTTLRVARRLMRNAIGIDIVPEYCEMARQRLAEFQYALFDSEGDYEADRP